MATLAIAGFAFACEPTVLIGSCAQPLETDAGEAGAGGSAGEDAVGVPWSTGFEDGLCGYHSEQGYCYARHGAAIEVVRTPVAREGELAAAFTVNADATTLDRSQARCVRQGVMPKSATYGAWYRVPALQTSDGNWNLFHFLGRAPDGTSESLWDVSLASDPTDGTLKLTVLNFKKMERSPTAGVPSIPIDEWFHIEFQLTRSAQMNGEVTLRQGGEIIFHQSNLITDDTEWGEWYVGNYSKALPAHSTVYVDEVTIREDP